MSHGRVDVALCSTAGTTPLQLQAHTDPPADKVNSMQAQVTYSPVCITSCMTQAANASHTHASLHHTFGIYPKTVHWGEIRQEDLSASETQYLFHEPRAQRTNEFTYIKGSTTSCLYTSMLCHWFYRCFEYAILLHATAGCKFTPSEMPSKLAAMFVMYAVIDTVAAEWLSSSPHASANWVQSPPEFSHVGIVPDDAAGRWDFSGISHFPTPSFYCSSIITSTNLIFS
ncbi:hypothetical protein PR048_012820 [Dryococelus australis]|uniref:Uncharacterized protein n=1 Tax=Dryococelus australis TaxID=614101 RepID=A0ABQ9HQG2_9NEOP|nr:hypothetical protein PR048_012820 [Dryococelus australis]